VGLNLFPDKKRCSFNCPYCEVFPFLSVSSFTPEKMEEDLRAVISSALELGDPVKNICFSGNGEPTLSMNFTEALRRAGRIRAELIGRAELLLITNGSFLLDETLFCLLKEAVFSMDLSIWLKLDAATPLWYEKINQSNIPFEKISAKIKDFAACAPFTIQTMVCAVDGEGPAPEEVDAWEKLIVELALIAKTANGESRGELRKVQIYGKARPSPEDPKATALPLEYLEERAASLRLALASAQIKTVIVEVYL
jgi:histidinol dehydrogenase